MSLSVPLEPPSKEILHISAHYLVILVKYIFNSIQKKNALRPAGGVKHSDSDLVETGMLSAKKTLR